MKRFSLSQFTALGLSAALLLARATAQVPDSAPPMQSNPPPNSAPAAAPKSSPAGGGFLGQDVPFFDPGSELISWDGKTWNISNNRLFEARFEKYLNTAAETSTEDQQYQKIIATILDDLAPQNVTTQSVDQAFRLLPKASAFEIDARLCDALADAVYSAWQAQNAVARLAAANDSLEQERKNTEWNTQVVSSQTSVGMPSTTNKAALAEWQKDQDMKRTSTMQPYTTRLAEIMALIKANQLKQTASQLQAKIEFQALIVQFFMQRRFQHVLMATRFYRAVFTDGNTKLQVGKDARNLFSNTSGMPPTVGTLDSMANEAIRDTREGVEAYKFLLSKDELASATKRLGESFIVGEYVPEIRTLSRDDKRRALDFSQKSNQLVSAIDVKDYALAEKLVNELQKTAKDFDASKPMAAIETARTISAMHIAKAKNAAVSGDKATLETELKEAAEIWPRNPALAEVSGLIFSQADVQQKALVDLDQLMSQHNYRQIYDDRMRFIAAVALYPSRQDQLKKVLDDMQQIEGAIIQATEIERQGNYAGAWETVEQTYQQFPEDSKLNQIRANLTTEAADFVRTLRTAQQLEKEDQPGSSLAWFLKARQIYPASQFASEGIARLAKKILPAS
jgi:hypothetical protein